MTQLLEVVTIAGSPMVVKPYPQISEPIVCAYMVSAGPLPESELTTVTVNGKKLLARHMPDGHKVIIVFHIDEWALDQGEDATWLNMIPL